MGAADYPIITDDTLPSIIEGEVARAIGHWDGDLSAARTKEFQYYYGKPFGNEVDGNSKVNRIYRYSTHHNSVSLHRYSRYDYWSGCYMCLAVRRY